MGNNKGDLGKLFLGILKGGSVWGRGVLRERGSVKREGEC